MEHVTPRVNGEIFWHLLLLFFFKKIDFVIFISFFEEVSNFRNRILTNQKTGIGDRKYTVDLYVLVEKLKEQTLAKYFIKVTERPNFV